MFLRISFLFIILNAGLTMGQTSNSQNMISVNQGWKFIRADVNGAESPSFDDSKWLQVTIPHTWNDKDTITGGNYYRGPGWYRIKLDIPQSAKEKRVFIKYEAASLVADVYFNGVHLGQHRGGFTAFCYELTSGINWNDDNILAVRVDNSNFQDIPPLSGDFNIFGGIYRPVWLIIKEQVCISPLDYGSDGVYIKQTSVTKEEAIIDVTAKVSNGLDKTVTASFIAACSNIDGSFEIAKLAERVKIEKHTTVTLKNRVVIKKPRLWNGKKDPFMYKILANLIADANMCESITIPFGFHFYNVDPNKGFFLNGESYPLHGVNRHQDRPGKGWAISYEDQDEDSNIIEELGATCVRCAHYPHSDYFYSLCDKKGFVVWAELPMVNQVLNTPEFAANAKQQLIELIRQRYNHPSICFWSLYNELGNSGKCDDPRELITQLNAIAKEEDTTRLTTAASNDPIRKWPGANAITDLQAWNTYPGWYKPNPAQMAKDIDRYKKDANGKPIGISEYGAGASINQHEQNIKKPPTPGGKWHPEEWQAIVHEENYAAMEARPYLWGTYVWVMFDFASAYRREGDTNAVNDKGLVTADRKTRKDAFYFYQAKWSKEPFVYITSRRFIERTDPNTTVKIYSNCDSVELKVNGQGLGTATSKNCIFKWNGIRLRQGTNTIEASAVRDGKTYSDKCQWSVAEPNQTIE